VQTAKPKAPRVLASVLVAESRTPSKQELLVLIAANLSLATQFLLDPSYGI
jgi:hypothetical protein